MLIITMEIFMVIVIGSIGLITAGSIAINSYLAHQPVNGEVKHLEQIEIKLKRNVEHLSIVTKQTTHYVKIN